MPKILVLSDYSSEYSRSLLKGVVRYSKEHGQWSFYRMPLNYRELYGEDGVVKWARKWRADAAIIAQIENLEVEKLCELNIPIVFHNNSEYSNRLPNLTGNYFQGGVMAARYYLHKGFSNYAFYGTQTLNWSSERCLGFIDELKKYSYEPNIYKGEISERNDQWSYNPDELVGWLRDLPKPVAVFCSADYFAIHITETCRLFGLAVPDVVAVLGVDDDPLICEISDPPLSSIRLDIENGGYRTAEMLHKLINGELNEPFNIIVNHTEIIERKSTERYATGNKELLAVITYIHSNFSKRITVPDLADVAHTSRRVLEKRFRLHFKNSIYQYILNLRVEKLAHLLIHTDEPLYHLAENCGFEEPKNIARIFKKAKGITPAHYRERYKQHFDF